MNIKVLVINKEEDIPFLLKLDKRHLGSMKRLLFISFLFFVLVNISHAQKEKYQSLFIYNFTKYIKWPDSYNSGKFVIGVIGDSPILESIKSMANSKKKTMGGSVIVVKIYGSVDEIDDCNILFVSKNVVNILSQIDNHIATKPILIITDSPGMANQGSVINFVETEGKIKFELNESKASSRGLIVSSSLAGLAILI